ncbi:hypothetical protein ACFLRI_04775, partial [Bacteroidota bacterium]
NINGGLLIHSGGLGLNGQYLWTANVHTSVLLSLDIHNIRHPKESKVVNPVYSDSKRYIFGKLNTPIPIKTGIGAQFIIADKENYSGIRLSGSFVIGSAFTLLKPEYLKVIYYDPSSGRSFWKIEKYNPSNTQHINQLNIYGGTSFFKGFNSLDATIGLYGKAWLSFEWNETDDEYKVLETGIMIDTYPDKLPIFAFIENKVVFINLFVNFNFGRRW